MNWTGGSAFTINLEEETGRNVAKWTEGRFMRWGIRADELDICGGIEGGIGISALKHTHIISRTPKVRADERFWMEKIVASL